jgi:hypothetical protein
MTSARPLVVGVCFACAACLPSTAPGEASVPPRPTRSAAPPLVPAPSHALLRVDFEKDPLGLYTTDRLREDWGGLAFGSQGLREGRASIVRTEGGQSLRVVYPKGSVGPSEGGAQFFVKLPGDHDDLTCSYRVRFGEGFDFVRGGKLPGLVGGSHPTGGHPADDGFSARLMWRAGGAVVQYVYFPRQTTTYGVDLPYVRSGSRVVGDPTDAAFRFQPGVWHTVVHRLVMNSPGQSNGILQAWFDGKLALDLRDRVWRLDATVHVDSLYFSTFFGGNDPSWGATRDEAVDFDDFVVSVSASALGADTFPFADQEAHL